MARKQHRDREDEGRRRRGGDQVILAVLLWMAPLGLFGYIGMKLAAVSGADPYAFLPQVEVWQVALFLALFLGAITGFVAYRLNVARLHAIHKRGRWDSYSDSVYESKN